MQVEGAVVVRLKHPLLPQSRKRLQSLMSVFQKHRHRRAGAQLSRLPSKKLQSLKSQHRRLRKYPLARKNRKRPLLLQPLQQHRQSRVLLRDRQLRRRRPQFQRLLHPLHRRRPRRRSLIVRARGRLFRALRVRVR